MFLVITSEITKANLAGLEEGRYERKQTLANAERFISPELKEAGNSDFRSGRKIGGSGIPIVLGSTRRSEKSILRLQKLAKSH